MRHRSAGRWLAPLALVTCVVAVYAVVQAGSRTAGGRNGSTATGPTTATTPRKQSNRKPSSGAAKPKFYVVKPGDVLSAIAAKTGVPVDRLQALNPSVDAQTLRVGQRLRLSR